VKKVCSFVLLLDVGFASEVLSVGRW